MAGFAHDIAGGNGNLVITSLQSPDFQHLVEGWQVRKDGSAEFNNLVIRGTFSGNYFILNTAGFFLYSGPPALGNLVTAVTSASGTDEFGNPYTGPGISVSGAGPNEIQIRPDLDAILVYAS